MQLRPSSKKETISNKDIEKEFKNLRKELLDLTLRNPLLNFKARNRNLSIINQSPMNAYKILVLENKRMYFAPNKAETKKSKAHAFIDQTREFLSSETDKTLKADLTPSELQKRLFYIDQQSKTMVQEQGYNILYIAIGFLEWVDKKKPRQKNLAPLILIPVALERKKVGNSFSLSWTGEDLQNNISIQAKLREIGIELPKFEQTSYIEGVNQYLNEVKKAIRPFKNWDVKDDVALGFFSFTKFVMYNDLNPESWSKDVDLTKNELIQAIFNPSKNIYEDTFEEEDVDEKLHYKTMYQVLDADSSQIAAIENVKAGHNLVVEGPPGTGKSQTIVNLIAELIAEGKTVLFVSEKMAALEVVKSRLDSVGLGKFVLELHSHKTRRKKLLKNLQKSTNVRDTRDLKLDQTLRKLENLRNQLDEYAEIIHKPVANVNLTPFELYGMKESSEDYFARQNRLLPLVRFDNSDVLSMKDLDDIIISLENLAELYSTISKNNPWSYCNPKSLLPADLREIELLIRDSLDSLNDFRYEMNIVNEVYGIKIPNTLKEYEDSITALNILNSESADLVDSSILLSKYWFNNPKKSLELIKLLQHYQHASGLFNKFTDYLLVADLDTIIYDLEKESNKKFRIFGGNTHKEELYKLYNGNVPNDKETLNDLIRVRNHIKIRQSLKDNEALGRAYFGDLWSENADVNELKQVANWMNKFIYLLSNGTFSETTVKMLSNDLFGPSIDSGIEEYVEKGNKFYENLKKLESKLNPRSKIIFKRETEDVPFDKWENQLNKWKGQLSSLHLWSQYSNTKKACMNTHASIFIKTVEKRNIKKNDVKPLVLGNFADSLLNIVFSENDTLATFIGELHENRIAEFKDLDRKIINLNRKRIFNKLNSEIPKIYGAANDPEAKVLAGEFTRKSGHLPVRTLLEKAGGTIKKIKPVFMMSPLSIAQYLDPTNPKLQFDVVIFDEASQVKPEDALGAFMRGKTAVVMGDTQQLPPTSFFDQMTDSESGEEVATALDMESILHLCKLSFPVKMLKWHYRSRHESLINISNREFYDNELLVYPSPSHNDPELGLKFHYNPNTAYHRGEGSANPLEAKDVVKEIFKHFEKYGDKKSLGVGTFSVAQKNAILEELEIERKAHPEFEPLFSDKREERFFVKNLETIQGDERDVILISVGYGYDTEGKMSLNFGPLNQDGGERRLNVLITRAREKCVVFTNFRAHDIHLTANPPFGVKSLQSFLEYAENLSLNQFIEEEDYEEAPFEDAIYNFLIENGYQVDKRVGCAGFRVDLAIIDEDNPGKYILGIQCDGHNYASSKVARDRDRLREQVLNGLGWNIYHIWSTDWYRNRDLARAKLLENVESTIINTKVNALKKKIDDVESMKINPITTVTFDNEEEYDDADMDTVDADIDADIGTVDADIDTDDEYDLDSRNIDDEYNILKENIIDKGFKIEDESDNDEKELSEEDLAKQRRKAALIEDYLKGFDEELNNISDDLDDIEYLDDIEDLNDVDDLDDDFDGEFDDDSDSIIDGFDNPKKSNNSIKSNKLNNSRNSAKVNSKKQYNIPSKNESIRETQKASNRISKNASKDVKKESKGTEKESKEVKKESDRSSNKYSKEAKMNKFNSDKDYSKNKDSSKNKKHSKKKESSNDSMVVEGEFKVKNHSKNTKDNSNYNKIIENSINKNDSNNKKNNSVNRNDSNSKKNNSKVIQDRNHSINSKNNQNQNNINHRAKSLMDRLRNIGDGLIINKDNGSSEDGSSIDISENKSEPKESLINKEKSDKKVEKQLDKSQSELESETYISNEDINNDIATQNIEIDSIEDNENLYEDDEINIIDDNVDIIDSIENDDNIGELENSSDIEDNSDFDPIEDEIEYIEEFDDLEYSEVAQDEIEYTEEYDDLEYSEDAEDEIEYIEEYDDNNIQEDINSLDNIEDISDVIIEEIEIEDSNNKELEDREIMRQYESPRRKKKEDSYDESADVIVPISAELRKKQYNPSDDVDYIVPIQDEELEELIEDNLAEDNYLEETSQDSSNESAYEQKIPENDSPYYYSAVGIENPLKKNAVQYPKNNDRNKTGIVGTVSSLKNDMLYWKASMDEIENPTEREMVYVIDRSADDEFFEDPYDPTQEAIVTQSNSNDYSNAYYDDSTNYESLDDDFNSFDNHYESPESDDKYESLFTAKKHEYLDKIEEYTKSSGSDSYGEDLSSNDYIGPIEDEFIHLDGDISSPKDSFTSKVVSNEFDESDDDEFIHLDKDITSKEEFLHSEEDIEIDDDLFEDIINDIGQDYQEIENERVKEANVLSLVDNTRLTPSGELNDYIVDYVEIEDIIIKSSAEIYADEKRLATAVMDIVAAEGPIHVDTVIRRLRESCKLSRAGTKFKNTILEAIDRNESNNNLIRENDFLFIDYDNVRIRRREKPNIDLISEIEIEKAIDLVLSFEKSLKVNDLSKKVSRAFGFRSTSKKTSTKIILVIDAMIGKGILINNNGKIEFR